MKNILLKVKYKINKGSKYNRKIRRKNIIPAIIYGNNRKNLMILLKHDYIYSIINKYKKENKDIILNLKLKNKIIKTKIKLIQQHPFKNKILHIDFMYI